MNHCNVNLLKYHRIEPPKLPILKMFTGTGPFTTQTPYPQFLSDDMFVKWPVVWKTYPQ